MFISDELGCCTKTKAKIIVKQSATPIFKPRRNVPFAALEQVNKELESLGIIEKTDHSDWRAPTVYVKKKNDKLRACTDFSTGLNDCLNSHNYPLLSPEEVFAKLNRGKFFLKSDLSEAYLQIQEEYAHLLVINTHHGLFKLKRLSFGVKVAPSVFQQIMDTTLADCDFAIAYLDNILKQKKSESHEHVERVKMGIRKDKRIWL
ncbi:uncharacterized protein K02A2.6-like [Octopus bimaculoides]|uniref:uncharacterized protein K02A2.6-like n=1 Tax=Octopus bimaculoides TaxID=37653 RepID=UPI00071CCAE0|nr:uncharacterized protein K02A2.6-like [Octopus bimaculoides]|eukprot:XP_014784253.1 PREDICTED: uncharacterized protein K02A2.6-like [Octopus bimaculoides]